MQTESLKKTYEFSRLYRKGKCNFGKYLSIYSIKDCNKKQKIGITVSKKAYKSSVKRNKLKRMIKESYRTFEKDIKNAEIVFVVRKSNNFPSFNEIYSEIKYLLKKSDLFIGKKND